jgi:ribosomal protein L37AE/L43A
MVNFLKQANEESNLEEKKVKAHHKAEHTCSFCGDKFKTRLELTTHKRERHGVV